MSRERERHPNEPNESPRGGDRQQQSAASTAEPSSFTEKYTSITAEIVEVVRKVHCPTATDVELHYFFSVCQKTGLDPLTGQIHLVKRKQKQEDSFGNVAYIEVARPLVGIDGFRVIAERTKAYRGQGPMQWCGKDGVWKDVWLSDTPPVAARATIYREGREPMVAIAHWREYVVTFGYGDKQKVAFKWVQSPASQLGKCAEALGLRKAFPNDLSGLHTDDEMEHVYSDSTSGAYSAPPTPQQKAAAVDVAATVAQQATQTAAASSSQPAALESSEQKTKADADLAAFRDACAAAMDHATLRKTNKLLAEYFDAQQKGSQDPIVLRVLKEGGAMYVNADQRIKQAARQAQQQGGPQ